jgi:hypothetical protein
MFDETEDLPPPPPRQDISHPERVIDIPKEIEGFIDDGKFEIEEIKVAEPLENWRKALAELQYSTETVEITNVQITSVTGKELAGTKWKTIHSAPDQLPNNGSEKVEITDDIIREAIKERVLQLSEELCVNAGYAAGFRGEVYGALMQHIRDKFLGGVSLGLAERHGLDYAWKMLDQVKAKIAAFPGLVGGMIEYAAK